MSILVISLEEFYHPCAFCQVSGIRNQGFLSNDVMAPCFVHGPLRYDEWLQFALVPILRSCKPLQWVDVEGIETGALVYGCFSTNDRSLCCMNETEVQNPWTDVRNEVSPHISNMHRRSGCSLRRGWRNFCLQAIRRILDYSGNPSLCQHIRWVSPQWHPDYGDTVVEIEQLRSLALAIRDAIPGVQFILDISEPGYIEVSAILTDDIRVLILIVPPVREIDNSRYAIYVYKASGNETELYFNTVEDSVSFISGFVNHQENMEQGAERSAGKPRNASIYPSEPQPKKSKIEPISPLSHGCIGGGLDPLGGRQIPRTEAF
ncbi:hypothetical protein FGO68_gene9757 [Halteria grandinella]|uniref:Uncharacterized protein n=1 Tax=Halteria grandinella TaxID=5974 RepID=A0A8J8NA72_HALGN|nr:hypothetical protein FGO68_gene9757 [Halteria grandinella]